MVGGVQAVLRGGEKPSSAVATGEGIPGRDLLAATALTDIADVRRFAPVLWVMTAVVAGLLVGCGEPANNDDELRARITELKPESATLSTNYLGCSRPGRAHQCAFANVLWPENTPYEIRRDSLRELYSNVGATLIVGVERPLHLLEYYEASDGSVLVLAVERDVSDCRPPPVREDALFTTCLDHIGLYPRELSPVRLPTD